MTERLWRAERDSRSHRYAGRVLDPERWILLRTHASHAAGYDGQVAVLTAANLLARMTPAVALDVPRVPIVAPLPWAGHDLREHLLGLVFKADPFGKFVCRPFREGDYAIQLAPDGAPAVAHGSGWNIYLGPPPSPLPSAAAPNPIGPAMAAILAAAAAFRSDLRGAPGTVLLNSLDWRHSSIEADEGELLPEPALGEIWTVGTGSVGTAILYFLALATRNFAAGLFDMDVVKIHNLDRSPLFIADHVGMPKVAAAAACLREAGLGAVRTDPRALDESALWRNREAGTPDILIPAANERNVRAVIETGFPPVQIYATTGRHWQAAVIRHVPFRDPCSFCLFPVQDHVPTECAGGEVAVREREKPVDAALPFLSFAAGAMAAGEILKLGLPGYPFSPNRVVLNTQPAVKAVGASLSLRPECICQRRSEAVHRRMIAGTRFADSLQAVASASPPAPASMSQTHQQVVPRA